ncbi:hypothetical protein Bca52824_028200 [Brassica carinata]|uniref:Uncharacterized protein n=1 Tax=Brassica carinata TaxID=52824 RepID=A0A8X8APH4_BRACI|nr:hypothetical protein Bca52824_028200 [Brassica carinata]
MGTMHRSGGLAPRRTNENAKVVITTILGIVFGTFVGITLPSLSLKINFPSGLISSLDVALSDGHLLSSHKSPEEFGSRKFPEIYVPTNPRGAELLPPGIVVAKLIFTCADYGENLMKWYAKRFLHPDVVSAYEYIFIWDEDLGVEHFNGDKYIELVKKHGLEISQPGLEPNNGLTWEMTKRRGDREVHKDTKEKAGWCSDPHLPPCAAFVEIMAPVFSREAWRCVWHMIQNDLVHGWGLDFALRRCVEPAHEKIGVVDSQWIIHKVIPSLGSQGKSENGKAPWQGVRKRCKKEWTMFQNRLAEADKEYLGRMVVKE